MTAPVAFYVSTEFCHLDGHHVYLVPTHRGGARNPHGGGVNLYTPSGKCVVIASYLAHRYLRERSYARYLGIVRCSSNGVDISYGEISDEVIKENE